MPTDHRAALARIKTLEQLIAYLRDEMGWPIAQGSFEDVDDLFYDFTAEELGIDPKTAPKIQSIKRLRPLSPRQPWGVFFVKFEPKKLPVVALRRILSQVALKKRVSASKSDRVAWDTDDLLFISNYGEGDARQITLAHFSKPPNRNDLPTLKVLGWNNLDTGLHLDAVAAELSSHLSWPDNLDDVDAWRDRWRSAFSLRHGEVVRTSKDLSVRLAALARAICDRIEAVLAVETKSGPLNQLMKSFQQGLVHDLDSSAFADMYAQTIAYGLLSARIADPQKKTVDDFAAHMRTNPFLRELMETFLVAGGRRGSAAGAGIDFDELGVSDVVDLLDSANMEAVVRDFGDRNQQEDPVIHFYERFLNEYDKQLKIQRGVFYTPQPVVSYIVSGIHQLLQTEFGLADGLADVTTWGEMLKRHPSLKLPPATDEPGETGTVSPDEPFVQILDPATGTATFLVEAIELIHATLMAKWLEQGLGEERRRAAWNEYVPRHLLPRLHAFELMMAPYAIAHMKIGLKLAETGYRFGTEERARIYLTNALEPWVKQLPLIGFEALARETAAVNEIKRRKRFTVVFGNPPYSKISSNLTPEMRATVERYRYLDGEKINERGALQFEINLQDDYVKFFRLGERIIRTSDVGVLGLITNNGYLSTPTLRGMRDSLLETFSSLWTLDLHGHLAKGETGSDGAREENVFDIVQGVSVLLGARTQPKGGDSSVYHAECYGSRAGKYSYLHSHARSLTAFTQIVPSAPFYLFIPHDAELALEWKRYIGLAELFPRNSAGIITARDGLVISESKRELAERLESFSRATGAESEVYQEFGFSESKRFDLRQSQSELRKLKSFAEPIRRVLHRPFDERFIFFHRAVVWSLSRPMAELMKGGNNLALIATRQVTRPQFEHVFVSRNIIEIKACSHDRNTQIFPLFIESSDGELALSAGSAPNLDAGWLARFAEALDLKLNTGTKGLGASSELSALGLFHFAYAILHCPSYRTRYFEFLRSDFPRLPLTANLELFRSLAFLGGELVALHLLESTRLSQSICAFDGPRQPVEKVSWSRNTVWIDRAQQAGFRGVPEPVWNFRIGGYQVCEKWLKDRKGRTLSRDDIAHYERIVGALAETVRLMEEIDVVVEQHGGWPGAFVSDQVSRRIPVPTEEDLLELSAAQMAESSVEYALDDGTLRKVAEQKPLFDTAVDAANVAPKAEGDIGPAASDLMCHIRSMFDSGAELSREETIAGLTHDLRMQQPEDHLRQLLDNALRTAARRGIIVSNDGRIRLLARAIDGYDRDFLKDQFLASLAARRWIERQDAIRAFARWLGYARTGSTIGEYCRSLIRGLLREGRLESRGSEIRRVG